MKPLAIDLFCGLGGWTDGLLAEGYDVIGYDIEAHQYGEMKYPATLVLQDVLTLHGSKFKDATLIVASPPCQEYSYMAMPWKLAKAKAAAIRADTTGEALFKLNRLFNACFRIQAEASLAAGRRIPMVVENVRGAQPWVGRAQWNFGSFYLWGDVPALMPIPFKAQKFNPDGTNHGTGSWFAIADSKNRGSSRKAPGKNWNEWKGWDGKDETKPKSVRPWGDADGRKRPGIKLSEVGFNVSMAQEVAAELKGAKYERTAEDKRQHIGINRKAASAMIAKIPFTLSRHIARVYRA